MGLKKSVALSVDMSRLKSLNPCRKDHAVKEAVLTVFVDAPISDVTSFKDLENHGILNYFQRFEIINQNQFNITLTESIPNVKSQKLDETGFKFIAYVDGKPSKVFQGLNEQNRYYFSFHDLAYTRWEQFKTLFDTCINLLGKHKGKFLVKAYSLHVVDEFTWSESTPLPYKEIFRENNKIIPSIFMESQSVDYLISRNKDRDGGVERIQINGLYNDDVLGSRLIVSHNYVEVMDDSTDALLLIQSETFGKKIINAHQENKTLVKELFNDEVLNIIHYH